MSRHWTLESPGHWHQRHESSPRGQQRVRRAGLSQDPVPKLVACDWVSSRVTECWVGGVSVTVSDQWRWWSGCPPPTSMCRAATSHPEAVTARLTVPASSVSSRSLTRPRVLRQMEIDINAMLGIYDLCFASVSASSRLDVLSSNVIFLILWRPVMFLSRYHYRSK